MNLYDISVSLINMPLVTIVGLYFSHKVRFAHISNLYKAFSFLKNSHSGNNNKSISSIVALSTILGGNLGTGNISGVAVALTSGGPGSLFWMSVIILITSVIKYVSCLLGIKYRVKNKNGQYVGGPMYYINKGTSSPRLAALFAISLILSAITVGNLIQVNSLTLPTINSSIPPILYGITIAIIVLLVTLGGMHWFAEVVTKIVPFMATIYLGSCIYILISNYNFIGPAFGLIFRLDALALSVIATATWLAGWLAGWLSHSGTVLKRLKLSENFFDHLKAPSF